MVTGLSVSDLNACKRNVVNLCRINRKLARIHIGCAYSVYLPSLTKDIKIKKRLKIYLVFIA